MASNFPPFRLFYKTISIKSIAFLESLKLSFVLLFFLLLLVVERAIISQQRVEHLGADWPWLVTWLNSLGLVSAESLDTPFLGVLFFCLINLLFSSARMIRGKRRKMRLLNKFKSSAAILALPCSAVVRSSRDPVTVLQGFFGDHGCRIFIENFKAETRIYASKNQAGRWSVVFFHFAFVVILAGILLSFLTRFSGYFELSPGARFIEERGNYQALSSSPLIFARDRRFTLDLVDIELAYWAPGEVKERASLVRITDQNGKDLGLRKIAVNRPLALNGLKIYQGSRHGLVAGLEVIDEVGTKATGTIAFAMPSSRDKRMTGWVRLPGTELVLEFELHTDRLLAIKGLESLGLHHKATLLKIFSGLKGRQKFQGVVFGGGSLLVEGLQIKFVSLTPYTSFVVVQDYGVPIIFAGFGLLLIGLCATYFWVPESFWVVVQKHEPGGGQVVIGASREKFKESFKEYFFQEIGKLESTLCQ